MDEILRGVERFQSTIVPARQARFAELARGQSPGALFITCADSRVDPNLITQQEPGALFVLRNVGAIVPPYQAPAPAAAMGPLVGPAEQAGIEYAVRALGVRDIIVCGHSQCGAMQALCAPALPSELPAVTGWLGHGQSTRAWLAEAAPPGGDAARLLACTQKHVALQLRHLETHPSVAQAMRSGALHLHGWIYDIASGEVWQYAPDRDTFDRLSQERRAR